MRILHALIRNEKGATSIEYSLMAVLISMACIGAFIFLGEKTQGAWEAAANGFPKTN